MVNKPDKETLWHIIFEADDRVSKAFDISIIVLILISILAVMLESVKVLQDNFGTFFKILEWIITIVFTIEYAVRVWIVRRPLRFIFSFFGIVDFLSFIPSYIGLFISGTQGLMVIRALRLLRIFRVLKLNRYINESNYLIQALKASKYKISIFLYAVIMIIIVVGAIMYLVEGEQNGFDSIPRSMYWVIVTITTVGFGDIVPHTTVGQLIASFIMILGYAIIAVPTGIVSAEISRSRNEKAKHDTIVCHDCLKEEHDADAKFCKHCGCCLVKTN